MEMHGMLAFVMEEGSHKATAPAARAGDCEGVGT